MQRPAPLEHRDDPRRRDALHAVCVYGLFGALWILASDWILGELVRDPAWRLHAGIAKGWVFIGVTAVALYLLLCRRPAAPGFDPDVQMSAAPPAAAAAGATAASASASASAAVPRRSSLLLWLVAAVIVAATVGVLRRDHEARVAHHAAQLDAVSELRTRQVEGWLRDRLSEARFAGGSAFFAGLCRRWRETGDLTARDLLMERLGELNLASGGRGAWVVDEHGEVIAGASGPDRSTPPALRSAALLAIGSGEVQFSGLYSDAGDTNKEWLDVVAPLAEANGPMRSAVVLRLDPNEFLLANLRTWPVPSPTAVTMLVRREGDHLVGARGHKPLPLSTPNLLSARAIRGEVAFGRVYEGLDHLGHPVLGVVRPVSGAEWFIVAKVDLAEIRAQALHDALPVVAVGALVLLGAVLGTFLLRERRALEAARADQARVLQREAELRRLGAELEAAENRERRKIAQDLHDDLAQTLAAARIRLASLCNDERAEVRSAARAIDGLVATANLSTRSLASQLAPPVLYELGLCPALEWLGEEIERTFGLKVTVLEDGQPKPLSLETSSIVYRATRELLINVAKHAGCDAAVVETVRDGDHIVVSVSDDGVGFDPARVEAVPHHGLGLIAARERLDLIGGTAEVHSAPGEGTVGVLSAPLATGASAPLHYVV